MQNLKRRLPALKILRRESLYTYAELRRRLPVPHVLPREHNQMRYDMSVKAPALILGFFSGIALLSVFPLGWWGVSYLLLLTGTCYAVSRVRNVRAYLLVILFLVGTCFGAARIAVVHNELPEEFVAALSSTVTLEGKVVADPDVRESNVRLTILAEQDSDKTKVLVVAPLFPQARFGERVRVTGKLERPEAFDTSSGRTFRYDSFLAKDGVYALMQNASLEVMAPRSGVIDTVRGFFSDLKFRGIDSLAVALPEPEASLAAGLVLGGKQGLGKELLDDFILVGLIHIVVLSGYNVMIVAEAVLRMFAVFAKRYAAIAAGVVIAGFVLTAGAGAASIRAGIMAGIALFGRASGRTYDALRALLIAGAAMLAWNPHLLLNDPGFQLSFVATAGLIFGTPIVERKLVKLRPPFLREVASSTIAAQIAVLPLLLYQNGLFSLVALPANVLILPVVPLVMALSALAGLAGFLVPTIAPLVALPAYTLLAIIIGLVEVISELPLAAVTIPAFPFSVVVAAYGLRGWGVVRANRKTR